MKNRRSAVVPCLTLSLLACLHLPLAAYADQAPLLSAEQPTMDSQPVTPPQPVAAQQPDATPQSADEHKTTFLNGEVKKQGQTTGDDQSQYNLQAGDSAANLQAETGAATAIPPYQLALQKLQHKQPLTADEYRSLGIGVLGYDTTRTYFQDEAVVDESYPGLPAYEAGIRKGDHEIVENVDDSGVKDPSRPSWMFSCGIAGQAMDITIRRGKQMLNFHMVRMNMEDIPDPKLRKTYEKLVQKLGSQPGTYEVNSDPRTPTAVSILKLLLKI